MQKPVKLFTLSTCSHCKSTKRLLNECDVQYDFTDVDLLDGEELKAVIEELKNEDLVNKVGGRFKLTALIQKRLNELMQGARPLIEDTEDKTMLEIVVEEAVQDKIAIDYEASGLNKPDEE